MEMPGEKLVTKLWETLAVNGVGGLLSPWQTKRVGRARNEVRCEELRMLAQAEADVKDIRAGRKHLSNNGLLMLTVEPSQKMEAGTALSDARIEPAFGISYALDAAAAANAASAARAEINTAKATLFAEQHLESDPQEPTDSEVDEDWLFTWRDYAGRVSAEDLQRLWGSVLAGEVKSPGKYSIRTLEFLKTLSKPEAELISKIAPYAIQRFVSRDQDKYLEAKGLTFGNMIKLQNLGIISGAESIGLSNKFKSVDKSKYIHALTSNGKALIVKHDDPQKEFMLRCFLITDIGAQILGLALFEPDLEYLRLVGKQVAAQGFTVDLCDWIQVSETEGGWNNAERIET